MRRGVSIIEVLVVIGVLGIIIAITIPAVAGARARARQLVCVANLHSTATALSSYLAGEAQVYPFSPGGVWLPTAPEGDPAASAILPGYWDLGLYWPSLMQRIAPWRTWFAAWICPGSPRAAGVPWAPSSPGAGVFQGQPSYQYCSGLFARPEVWMPFAAPDPTLLRPVRDSDVSYPANKVILFDSELAHVPPKGDRDRVPMLFVDGHAVVRGYSAAAAPVVNPFTNSARRLVDTPDGARGLDYR